MTLAQTFSGRAFDFDAALRGDDVDIDIWDIAHALAHICRFNGHCRQLYTVAQHSVLVAERARVLAEEQGHDDVHRVAAAGLLHDATEAYIGDMIRPLKSRPELRFFRDLEQAVADAIARRFGLCTEPYTLSLVDQADDEMLAVEAGELLNHPAFAWQGLVVPPESLHVGTVWTPDVAYAAFARYAHGVGLLDLENDGSTADRRRPHTGAHP